MGGAFSSSSSSTQKKRPRKEPGGSISDVDRAVLDLKNARDRLTRYKKKLELDEVKLTDRARQAKKAGDTKTALNLLRLKKYKRTEVDNVNGQLLTVLQMVETISSKENEKEVLTAVANGKDSLEKLHQETSLEDVLDLMDKVQEQAELEAEISQVLAGVPSLSSDAELEVERELAALEQATEEPIHLPSVPTTELPTPEKVEPVEAKTTAAASKPARVAVPS